MWASLITSETKNTNDTNDKEFKYIIPNPVYPVNKVNRYKLYNTSYDNWEYHYFEHILNILQILKSNKIIVLNTYNNIELIYLLGQFLYEISSGYISPYLKPIPEQLYKTYLIKRESYTKDEYK